MKVVILLSGGIDSAVLLASMHVRGDEILAVSFDYGQTHRKELDAARDIAGYYGVEHEIIPISEDILDGSVIGKNNSVVPARNLVMLSIAVAIADRWGATAVAFGVNRDDINGFSDCRPEFITALNEAVYQCGIRCRNALAPFVGLTKNEVIALGKHLVVPLYLTWSCYRGADEPCRNCGACELREGAIS